MSINSDMVSKSLRCALARQDADGIGANLMSLAMCYVNSSAYIGAGDLRDQMDQLTQEGLEALKVLASSKDRSQRQIARSYLQVLLRENTDTPLRPINSDQLVLK